MEDLDPRSFKERQTNQVRIGFFSIIVHSHMISNKVEQTYLSGLSFSFMWNEDRGLGGF